jgi:hypothetical protein
MKGPEKLRKHCGKQQNIPGDYYIAEGNKQ